jgi:two-component system chemotaxis response regulator CheY
MVKKILIVDDSETIRQQVRFALPPTEFVVLEASDGFEGLEQVAQQDDLALVLLDINMPGLGGLDMLERMRAEPNQSDVAVLMLTTEVERSLIERAKRAGAKGWLIKPVKPELLLAAVTKFVRSAG